MSSPLLTELPYRPDSAALFEAIADLPWAVLLDSGLHHPGQSRYDILVTAVYWRTSEHVAVGDVRAQRVSD